MLKLRPSNAVVLALVTSFGALVASAQILNSERIEQTFGSFGIDVLYSDESLRVSSLYSEEGGARTTRTVAVVQYPALVDGAFTSEHQVILDGGSIGATFKEAGWEVVKINLSTQEMRQPDEITQLMSLDGRSPLATHFYQLDIRRQGERIPYAEIVEIHHPDYLTLDDLQRIYPLDVDTGRGDLLSVIPPTEVLLRRHLRLMYAGLSALERTNSSPSQ